MPQPSLLGFLQDKDSQRAVGRGLLDAANRGWIAQTFGAPVDMATQAVNLGIAGAGYLGHKAGLLKQPPALLDAVSVPGSSEWIGQKMQNAGMVSPERNPIAEAGMGLLSPVAFKGAQKVGGLLANAEMKAAENLASPSTMPLRAQRGAVMAAKPKLVVTSGDGGLGPQVPTRVIYDDSADVFRFGVGEDGHAFVRVKPVWKTDKEFVKQRMFRAVDDFLWPYGDDVYMRVGNASDVSHLRAGSHRGSTNHFTGEPEGGLSVARRIETGDDLAYLVKGRRVGSGSDSEPLLDPASAQLVGEPLATDKMLRKLNSDIEKKARAIGIDPEQLKALYVNRRLLWPDAAPEKASASSDWRSMAINTYKSGS